jgi:hypothetical protein
VVALCFLFLAPSSDGLSVSLPPAIAGGAAASVSSPSMPTVQAATKMSTGDSAHVVADAINLKEAGVGAKAALKVGVYYFPGWRDRTPAAPSDYPWNAIKKFPEREPLLGWYAEGDADVMASHLDSMAKNGVGFVAFDWYWGSDNRVYLGHALDTYLKLKDKRGVQFSLLWANHDDAPVSLSNFDRMIDYWVRHYFSSPSYLRVDGKPLVTVFSASQLEERATKMGVTVAQLLARASKRAQDEGLQGIYFVAGTTSDEPGFKKFSSSDSGYSAVSAYNLHWWPGQPHPSHSYVELDNAYRSHWSRYRSIGQLPVVVPMTSGWDKRPWGGSDDALHDNSLGTPDEFEIHLRAGVQEILRGGAPYLGVICCWNEFGEGSYVEPTKKLGDSVVRKVGKVMKEAVGS